jgi:hypothetical protein
MTPTTWPEATIPASVSPRARRRSRRTARDEISAEPIYGA